MIPLTSSSLVTLLGSLLCASALVEAAVANHQSRSRQHAQLAAVKRGENYGMATFYNAETGNKGACGWFIGNSDWSVAIKGSMYGDYGRKSSWCGRKISITANAKTARNVLISDACPGCPEGASLDMTPELFKFFSNPDAGVIPISWHLSSEDGNSNQDFKPLAPAKDLWKPSPTSSKQKSTPSKTSTSSSEEWLPLSSLTPWDDEKGLAQATSSSIESTWTASSTYSAMNATRTTPVNSTDSTNSTSLSNSTAVASMIRGNNTIALLPSNGVGPALKGGPSSSQSNSMRGGNLHRAAQIVLDLAGLTYAAATK